MLTVYRPLTSTGFNYIRTDGKRLQLVTEMFFSIEDINRGHCDEHVKRLARAIKEAGREVWLRPLHEFNGDNAYYNWHLYPYTPAKIRAFKRAWRRIANLYKAEGAPVKLQLCFMAKNPNGDTTPFAAFYPGDAYVDQVGVDLYINSTAKKMSLKQRLDDGLYRELSQFGKPIFIGEMSASDVGMDKAEWIRQAWHDLAVHFPRIKVVNFFLENKSGGREWGLNTEREVRAFVDGVREFRTVRRLDLG